MPFAIGSMGFTWKSLVSVNAPVKGYRWSSLEHTVRSSEQFLYRAGGILSIRGEEYLGKGQREKQPKTNQRGPRPRWDKAQAQTVVWRQPDCLVLPLTSYASYLTSLYPGVFIHIMGQWHHCPHEVVKIIKTGNTDKALRIVPGSLQALDKYVIGIFLTHT